MSSHIFHREQIMTTYTYVINTMESATRNVGANESLLVASNGGILITTGAGDAISAADNTTVNILGVVGSVGGAGLYAGGPIRIEIGDTGSISGRYGLDLENGEANVVNYGTISGTTRGIHKDGSGPLTLLNKGIIEGSTLENGYSILCAESPNTIVGDADTIVNEGIIRGGRVSLRGGNDIYYGRNGFLETVVMLGDGDDHAFGGAGSDHFEGDAGDDLLDGGAGNDTMVINQGNVNGTFTVDLRISGPQDTGEGFDTLVSIENVTVLNGNYQLIGNDAGNFLAGGFGTDILSGGNGNDTLFGGPSNDVFIGGSGIDTVTFTAPFFSSIIFQETIGAVVNLANTGTQDTGYGSDTFTGIENLIGTSFADTFTGDDSTNTFWGKLGNDTLDGAGGDDVLVQEEADGDDRLVGGSGIDTVSFGGTAGAVIDLNVTTAQATAYGSDIYSGIENLSGGSGSDRFTGNTLANTLIGNAGDDTLDGGYGKDVLIGGAGNDTFVFKDRLSKTGNVDKITDYNKSYDSIQLDNRYMPKLGKVGHLSKAVFALGTKATTTSQHLIYDKAHGNLYYDADGSGHAAQVLIAQFTNKAALTYSEFTII